MMAAKATTIATTMVAGFLAMLAFCWLVLLTESPWFWGDPASHPLVAALAGHGLLSYNSAIGGHQAHLHDAYGFPPSFCRP